MIAATNWIEIARHLVNALFPQGDAMFDRLKGWAWGFYRSVASSVGGSAGSHWVIAWGAALAVASVAYLLFGKSHVAGLGCGFLAAEVVKDYFFFREGGDIERKRAAGENMRAAWKDTGWDLVGPVVVWIIFAVAVLGVIGK